MREGELLRTVARKRVNELTYEKILDWSLDRLKYMSNLLYTIQAEMMDIPENEKEFFHLGTANEYIRHAIKAAGEETEENIIKDWKISFRVALDHVAFSDADLVIPPDLTSVVRLMINQKKRIYDTMSVAIEKHDKMSGRTDKMSGFVKEFFTELDKFEEELYNVV